MKAFVIMLVTCLVFFIMFIALVGPMQLIFDTIQDQANETLGNTPNANASTMKGLFSFFRPIFGFICVISFAATIILYVVDVHRAKTEDGEWRG